MATNQYSAQGVTSSRTYGLESGNVQVALDKYVMTVLLQDVLKVLRGVALEELNAQIRIGNNPSQVLVDGRSIGARSIQGAMRKVSMRFTDTRLLITAAKEIYEILQRITRIQSPAKNSIVARKNYYLWLNGRSLGSLPGALTQLTPDALSMKSVLRVVGPLVPYGRKLYWRPIGRGKTLDLVERTNTATGRSKLVYGSKYEPRFKPYGLRSIKRLANQSRGDKAVRLKELLSKRPGTAEGAGQIVKRIMRRNKAFASLYISDGWVNYAPAKSWGKRSKDAKVPSVSVQLARKGSVRVIDI